MKIEEYIQEGRENAISQSELSRIVNVPERVIRREIEEARINRKQLIIGDEQGYYFPADIMDIRGYVNRRKASISTSRKALSPFIRALKV